MRFEFHQNQVSASEEFMFHKNGIPVTFMFLALAQLTNKAFTDAGKGRIRQSLTALVTSLRQLKRFEARISLFKSLDRPLALAAAGMN